MATIPMTPEEYAQHHGDRCPVCQGAMTEGDEVVINDGAAHQDMRCHDCGAEWVDEYRLARYIGKPCASRDWEDA
jgi:transposase-like protein